MSPATDRPARRLWTGAAASALGLVALAAAVSVRDPLPGESWLLRRVVVTDGAWQDIWTAVADATDLPPLIGVAVVGASVLALTGRRRTAVLALLGCAVVWLLNPLLKSLVGRPRPDLAVLPNGLSEHSFPSGHAANSAVLVGMAVLVVVTAAGGRATAAVAVAGGLVLVAVAAAQLALARHYPSDIAAGWLVAAAVVLAVLTRAGDERHGGPGPNSQTAP